MTETRVWLKTGLRLLGTCVLCLTALTSCGGSDGTGPGPNDQPRTLLISPTSSSVRHPGDTVRLRPLGSVASEAGATFEWSADNPAIATISSDGLVTAVGYGTGTIRVRSSGLEAAATVTVAGETSIAFLQGTWSTRNLMAPEGLAETGTLYVTPEQTGFKAVWRGELSGTSVEVVSLLTGGGISATMVRADGVRGTFVTMEGIIEPGEIVLHSGTRLGGNVRERSVMSAFASNSFHWRVEESADGGTTWELVWEQELTKVATQASPGPLEAVSPACSADIYRAFDFWRGDWRVTVPSGGVAGTNLIHRVAGCGIQENWTDATSGGGVSLNMYDPRSGKWSQYFLSSTGSTVILSGGMQDGAMIMTGTNGGANDRLTWSLLDGGRVRQFWERGPGTNLSTYFDGIYAPR